MNNSSNRSLKCFGFERKNPAPNAKVSVNSHLTLPVPFLAFKLMHLDFDNPWLYNLAQYSKFPSLPIKCGKLHFYQANLRNSYNDASHHEYGWLKPPLKLCCNLGRWSRAILSSISWACTSKSTCWLGVNSIQLVSPAQLRLPLQPVNTFKSLPIRLQVLSHNCIQLVQLGTEELNAWQYHCKTSRSLLPCKT